MNDWAGTVSEQRSSPLRWDCLYRVSALSRAFDRLGNAWTLLWTVIFALLAAGGGLVYAAESIDAKVVVAGAIPMALGLSYFAWRFVLRDALSTYLLPSVFFEGRIDAVERDWEIHPEGGRDEFLVVKAGDADWILPEHLEKDLRPGQTVRFRHRRRSNRVSAVWVLGGPPQRR